MDVKEKLVELIGSTEYGNGSMVGKNFQKGFIEKIASNLIDHGVTVQKHGYLETVVDVKDNTVCGNGVKIEYKRCSCCKNPAKFFEDDFCGNCGAKLDSPQPPKGE